MSFKKCIDKQWQQILPILEMNGWKSAESELKSRIFFLNKKKPRPALEIESAMLVLSTLQQKFGKLSEATVVLNKLKLSKNEAVSLDSTVRLGKILSQQGKFYEAREEFSTLVPDRKSCKIWSHCESLPSSVLWRLGFLEGTQGNLKNAKYWLSRHQDLTHKHGSQAANNKVFENLIALISGEYDFVKAHEANEKGLHKYLQDSLSVKNVKFINISKSAVVPLILDGVIMLELRENLSGLLQLVLCRRLLQYEGITLKSEGVSEVVNCLNLMKDKTPLEIFTVVYTSNKKFYKWLHKYLKDKRLVNLLIDQHEQIFQEFIVTRNYKLLSVFNFGSMPRYHEQGDKMDNNESNKRVFLIHGHDELNLLKLEKYLQDDLKIDPIILKDKDSEGRTLIEFFQYYAEKCSFAIAIFTKDDFVKKDKNIYSQMRPNVLFELGWFWGKLGRKNVTIICQKGIKIPSDLEGIVRIEFEDRILDKTYELKKALMAAKVIS